MTLAVGIVTPRGLVIAADGLMTFGTVQVPTQKVHAVGQTYGIGLSGNANMIDLAVRALQACPLALDLPHARTIADATNVARAALQTATMQYLGSVAWVTTMPVDSQIGSAALLFGGLCSDGPFLAVLDNRGNVHPLAQPHYHAIGSAHDAALVLLRAYAAYDYAVHPLDTSVLLAKRVIDQVSAAIPAIGGQVSVLAISHQAPPQGQHLRLIDPTSPLVQDGLTTWQLLEGEMFADLAAWTSNPPTGACAGGPGPATDPGA